MSGELWMYTDNDASSLYCELCDYKAGTAEEYEAHIHGFKHKTQLELARNDPHREIRSNHNYDFHCSLCDINCSSREMLNTHLRGQKHLKKRANSDNSVGFYQSDGRRSKASVLEGKLVDFDKAVVGLGFIVEIHPSDNKKEPRFLCELCNAKSDIRVIGSHLVGQKHRQKYMKHTRWEEYNNITRGKYNAKINKEELERLMVEYEAVDGRGKVVIRGELDDELVTVEVEDIKDDDSIWGRDSAEGSVRGRDYRYEEDRKGSLCKIERDYRSYLKRSTSPDLRRSRSPRTRRSRSPRTRRSRSPRARHSRSPQARRSRSRTPRTRRSPRARRSISPYISRNKSPRSHRSRSPRSGSPRESGKMWEKDLKQFLCKMKKEARRSGSTERSPTTWKTVFTELMKKIDDYYVEDEEEADYALSISNTLTQKLLTYRLTNIPSSVRHLMDPNAELTTSEQKYQK